MARWEGRCNSREIREGVPLLLMAKMQIAGQPRDKLIGAQDLPIELSDSWINAKLLQANSHQAILEMPSGDRWIMTPKQPRERGSNIETPGMFSEDWIVREKLDPKGPSG